MNFELSSIIQKHFNTKKLVPNTDTFCGPGSTILNNEYLINGLPSFLKKYNIESIFDSGCGDLNWIKHTKLPCSYQGGDISKSLINYNKIKNPKFNTIYHDATTDLFPKVDLIFVKDVTIHLNNIDKIKLLKNFVLSNIDFLLITNNPTVTENFDFKYDDNFPESQVNWKLSPWNFPQSLDTIKNNENKVCMELWNKHQIKNVIHQFDNIL